MARRHRHMIGYRILQVLVIPTMYYLCVSLTGLLAKTEHARLSDNFIHSRRLLQVEESTPALILEGEQNCTSPSIQEFPSDGLTRAQRQSGFLVVHIIIAIYTFFLLAIVCDDFFVPSITKICHKMQVTKDVAGATFMAAASSSPELFVNIVGTFVTEGDLGIGTIVGSAVFNILAVPAFCGLFANQVLDLEWWPISRDCMAYGVTVLLLIFTLHDGRIEWYEALILVISYILYILAMFFNQRIRTCMTGIDLKKRRKYKNLNEETPLMKSESRRKSLGQNNKIPDTLFVNGNLKDHKNCNGTFINGNLGNGKSIMDIESLEIVEDESAEIVDLLKWPGTKSEKIWWIITWPINFVLLITIPDCRRPILKSCYPLTFVMCIAWIGASSYIIGWDITIIGDTLQIPDSVMGLTFLAAGMSVPEAVSSVIVTNQGHGTMGINNSIGSNVFDVLLCLGLPWFIKAAFLPKVVGQHYVKINSEGLVYSSVSLLSTLIILYVLLLLNKFKLNRNVGLCCLAVYGIFLVFASAIELNVFFPVNRPVCDH